MPGDDPAASQAREAAGDGVAGPQSDRGRDGGRRTVVEGAGPELNRARQTLIQPRRTSMTEDPKQPMGVSRRGLLGGGAKLAGAAGLVGAIGGGAPALLPRAHAATA